MSKNSVKNFLSDERDSYVVTADGRITIQTPDEAYDLVTIEKDTPPPPYDMAGSFPIAAGSSTVPYRVQTTEQRDNPSDQNDEDITSPPPAYNQIVTSV